MKLLIVNCPQCGKALTWKTTNRHRPFCSERCKIQDLAQWATESYRIPETTQETDSNKDSSE
ncbi:DNA gyrase inhibitor YacG [Nitrosomonas sp.]|uniref:DNA gyrase inhibitor YacG n=1 Tax=Nitrosomonas sp. TaxID=42353 RepID=UPI00261C2955|nr:DNA gyrase inhibitor YacG [Nitrosomonas sp.]MCW5601101.1 DNA gyrase inhibitor YacG [Nitrosomonas sp.]